MVCTFLGGSTYKSAMVFSLVVTGVCSLEVGDERAGQILLAG